VVRSDLAEALKDGARTAPCTCRRLRGWLVVGEVALSAVLLSGAGVLIKSFIRHSAVDPGFRPEDVLAVRIQRQKNQERFASDVLEPAATLPGVVAVQFANDGPGRGAEPHRDGSALPRPTGLHMACHRVATRDYFHVVGMQLIRGRSFTAADTRDRPRVTVVNEAFARKAWPGQDGVVADAKCVGLADESFPEMFFSMEQGSASSGMTFVLRVAQEPESLAGAIRRVIRDVDRDQPVTSIGTLQTLVAESTAPQRVTILLSGIFGLLALVLAGTGPYGLVSQRTHEIGVRMAPGAPAGRVVQLIVGESLVTTLAGLALGLQAAVAFGRVLSGLLFRRVRTTLACPWRSRSSLWQPASPQLQRATEIDRLSVLRCN
jgi:putative ABC transport system permease protein